MKTGVITIVCIFWNNVMKRTTEKNGMADIPRNVIIACFCFFMLQTFFLLDLCFAESFKFVFNGNQVTFILMFEDSQCKLG